MWWMAINYTESELELYSIICDSLPLVQWVWLNLSHVTLTNETLFEVTLKKLHWWTHIQNNFPFQYSAFQIKFILPFLYDFK